MKNIIKVAFLSSIITAAMVYVVLEWRPLRSETARAPEVSWASSVASSPAAVPAARLSDEERNNIEVYQKYSQGVVNITTTTVGYDFFLRPVPMASGTGSGAIIDTQGHIVTNFHVIREAERLEVTLPDKTKHIAKVVGSDPNNDLAVIQIDLPHAGLIPIPVGTSKGLQVGQKVLAIGNPYGLERTLTTGIISSLGRSIQYGDCLGRRRTWFRHPGGHRPAYHQRSRHSWLRSASVSWSLSKRINCFDGRALAGGWPSTQHRSRAARRHGPAE